MTEEYELWRDSIHEEIRLRKKYNGYLLKDLQKNEPDLAKKYNNSTKQFDDAYDRLIENFKPVSKYYRKLFKNK